MPRSDEYRYEACAQNVFENCLRATNSMPRKMRFASPTGKPLDEHVPAVGSVGFAEPLQVGKKPDAAWPSPPGLKRAQEDGATLEFERKVGFERPIVDDDLA